MTKEEYIQDTAQKLMLKTVVDYRTDVEKLAKWAAKSARVLADMVFLDPEPLVVDDSMFEIDDVLVNELTANASNCEARIPSLYDTKKDAIVSAMNSCNGNRRKAAMMLGISERTLYRKVTEYGLERKRN